MLGRMPPGYGKCYGDRSPWGTPYDDTLRSFLRGIDPLPWSNPTGITDQDWMGLSWSSPRPLSGPLATFLLRVAILYGLEP